MKHILKKILSRKIINRLKIMLTYVDKKNHFNCSEITVVSRVVLFYSQFTVQARNACSFKWSLSL